MSDGERLTILEMEYAIVAARLNAIDAQLALIVKRVEDIAARMVTLEVLDERTERIERMVGEIARHVGLDGD